MDGMMTEAYGHRLGERARVENASAIVSRALRNADMAVTEVRCDNPRPGMSGPIRPEDAFLVSVQLRDCLHRNTGRMADERQCAICGLAILHSMT